MSGTIPDENTLDGMKIRAHGGDIVCEISPKYLVHKGYIAKPQFYFVNCDKCSVDLSKYNSVEFQKYFISAIAENQYRNEIICDLIGYNLGKKVLVIVQFIKHGEILYNMLKDYVDCKYIHGKTAGNYKIIKEFNNDKFKILIGSSILDEGITFPSIDILILAAGGKSQRQLAQRIGRGLDPVNEKVVVFDFMDNFHRVFKKHSNMRRRYIEKQGFDVKIIDNPITIGE
jgi:superfamily II DNA or RNA helicase